MAYRAYIHDFSRFSNEFADLVSLSGLTISGISDRANVQTKEITNWLKSDSPTGSIAFDSLRSVCEVLADFLPNKRLSPSRLIGRNVGETDSIELLERLLQDRESSCNHVGAMTVRFTLAEEYSYEYPHRRDTERKAMWERAMDLYGLVMADGIGAEGKCLAKIAEERKEQLEKCTS